MSPQSVVSALTTALNQRRSEPHSAKPDRFVAALSLQAIAAADVDGSDEAWETLVAAVFGGAHAPGAISTESLAYMACGSDTDRDRVLAVFDKALDHDDVNIRTAAIQGLRRLVELDPRAAGAVAPRLGAALERRCRELVSQFDDVERIEDLSADHVRPYRSSRSAAAGLCRASEACPRTVEAVSDERRLPDFLREKFEHP